MASSIPFDHPSLVLGHVVNNELIALLEKLSSHQAKIDAAFEKLNSFISMRRGLSMTITELVGLEIETAELGEKIKELNKEVGDAASDYMAIRIENETAMQTVRAQIGALENVSGSESPLELKETSVKYLPLASDSLKMDVQYFSYGSNADTQKQAIMAVEKAVQEGTEKVGDKPSRDMAKEASSQINQQHKNHDVSGTLVITASCAHRNTALVEAALNIDRAVDIWNHMHVDAGLALDTTDLDAMRAVADTPMASGEAAMTLLTGASYGSSFVGMVHFINKETAKTDVGVDLEKQLQEQIRLGGWLRDAAGGFGVDESMLDNVRKLLSSQSVSIHANLIVLGTLPTITASNLELGVSRFLDGQTKQAVEQNDSVSKHSTGRYQSINSSAESAAQGAKVMAMQGGMMQSLIQGLGKIDQGSNQVVDTNTLMTAFTNYINGVRNADGKGVTGGMPINFLYKKFSRSQLARMWLEKYYASMRAEGGTKPSGTSKQ